MKNLVLTIVMMFVLVAQGFTQAQKTLVKSLENQGNGHVTLALAGNVEVEEWDKDYLRVITNIEVLNFNESILKRLVMVGRYTVESANDEDGSLIVIMPKLENIITIQGVDLDERLSFKVYLPAGMNVEIKNPRAEGIN